MACPCAVSRRWHFCFTAFISKDTRSIQQQASGAGCSWSHPADANLCQQVLGQFQSFTGHP
eukprot:2111754-Amphidinium_carterae.1